MPILGRWVPVYCIVLMSCLCLMFAGACAFEESSEDKLVDVGALEKDIVEEEELGELVSLMFMNPVDVLEAGQSRQLLVAGVYESGGTQVLADVGWESEAPGIVSVEGGRVRGLRVGSARIVVQFEEFEAALTIQVVDYKPAKIVVEPAQVQVDWESSVEVLAVVESVSGPVSGVRLVWSSADPQIATVTQNGRIEGRSAGATTIAVTHGSLRAEVAVVVGDPELHGLVVVPDVVGLVIDANETLIVEGRTEQGNALPVTGVTWTSLNPAVATVDGTGLVTARSNGEALVLVEVGALWVSVPVLVDPAHHRIVFPGPCRAERTQRPEKPNTYDDWIQDWTYDEQGRVIEYRFDRKKDGIIESEHRTRYEENGRRAITEEYHGLELYEIRELTYDEAGRLLTEVHKSAGGTIRENATYTYDEAGRLLEHFSTKLPGPMLHQYFYDNQGRNHVIKHYYGPDRLFYKQTSMDYDPVHGGMILLNEKHHFPEIEWLYWGTARYFYNSQGHRIRAHVTGVQKTPHLGDFDMEWELTYVLDFAGNVLREERREFGRSEVVRDIIYRYDCWLEGAAGLNRR